ncbi:hypothetical protein JTB14_014549 [Gonioctena quinquepunctata]|nr:hypothetical protein JTB14_014549 [Gonioctena quinquepunctata]
MVPKQLENNPHNVPVVNTIINKPVISQTNDVDMKTVTTNNIDNSLKENTKNNVEIVLPRLDADNDDWIAVKNPKPKIIRSKRDRKTMEKSNDSETSPSDSDSDGENENETEKKMKVPPIILRDKTKWIPLRNYMDKCVPKIGYTKVQNSNDGL